MGKAHLCTLALFPLAADLQRLAVGILHIKIALKRRRRVSALDDNKIIVLK
jgi:hypothetical protein